MKNVAEIFTGNMNAYETKTKYKTWQIAILAMLAGAFIAIGGSSSSAATFAIENPGLAKCLAGCIFPVGLMLVVFMGAELFTGDCLMIAGVVNKRISVGAMIRVLVLVYIFNIIGSVLVAYICYGAGLLDLGSKALAASAIKTAYGKMNLGFLKAFCSGIMCNILVCLAVLFAGAATDAIGKIFGCFFPIWAFVVAGYEHCVANMYYIPMGLIAKSNPAYVEAATNAGMTADQINSMSLGGFFIGNLLPVTLGNIVGGMIFVALPLYFVNKKKITEAQK